MGAVALITVFTARRRDRALLIAAVGAGVLVIVQALLGGQVVIQQLRRELVTAHLGMALTVLALTILIADRAVHGPMPRRRSALPVGLIGLTTAAVFAQMLLGSWVTGHDAGLAYPDFPLMNGSLLPAVDAPTQAIQVAHRALAVAVAGLVVWTAVVVRRRTQSGLPRTLAAVAVGLVVVQVALGAAQCLVAAVGAVRGPAPGRGRRPVRHLLLAAAGGPARAGRGAHSVRTNRVRPGMQPRPAAARCARTWR